LQVRQEVVAHQFGALLQQIPVATVSEDLEDAQQGTGVPLLAPEEAIVSDDALMGLQAGEERGTRQAELQQPPEQWPDGALAEPEKLHEPKTHLLAGAQLAAIKESWQTASVQQQRVMVATLLEPEGMQYAIEQERVVGLIPRPPFVPWFGQIPGARLVQTEQGSRIVLELSADIEDQLSDAPASNNGRLRDKRASPEQEPVQGVLAKRRRPLQRRPGPDHPAWKIDPSYWPEVVKRIEQGGSLRQVAREYQVSHETIRRVLVTVQGSEEKNRSRNRHAREKEVISVPRSGEGSV
jgi:Helix-turn-helix domain of resolvase